MLKLSLKKLLSILLWVFLHHFIHAQELTLSAGYIRGSGTSVLKSLSTQMYYLSKYQYPDSPDPLSINRHLHGFQFGVTYGKRGYNTWTWSTSFTNRREFDSGTYRDSTTNQTFDMDILVRNNSWSPLTVNYHFIEWFSIGVSPFEIGKFRILSRKNGDRWTDYYTDDGNWLTKNMILGNTITVNFYVKKYFLHFQLGAYSNYSRIMLKYPEAPYRRHQFGSAQAFASVNLSIPVYKKEVVTETPKEL